jgi:UDP:flavonoid glycosyltransferase YjiC (YdhE family)
MRVVAIASSTPGHTDFGGNGFIRVMNGLRRLGHDVQWLSHGSNARRLVALGWPTHRAPELKMARIRHGLTCPTQSAAAGHASELEIARTAAYLSKVAEACRRLVKVLADLRPDVLIIDRVSTLCSAVAQELEVPFVALGTPGGYWEFVNGGRARAASSPLPFVELSEALRSRLGWRRADVHSAWLRSDDLNVTFLGRSFYGESGERPGRTSYVNLFERADGATAERGSLGIVLGNWGTLARMRLAIESLVEQRQLACDEPIEVLAGGRRDSPQLRELLGMLASHRVTTHGWVDYGQTYSRMRRVISFGGIGAIWQALNHRLPMLLVDGDVGDQRFNCLAIERLGAGEVLHQDADGSRLGEVYARLRGGDRYVAAIDALCAEDNYSDSLESVVGKIVNVARR